MSFSFTASHLISSLITNESFLGWSDTKVYISDLHAQQSWHRGSPIGMLPLFHLAFPVKPPHTTIPTWKKYLVFPFNKADIKRLGVRLHSPPEPPTAPLLVSPPMTLQVIYPLPLATLRALFFHDADGVGVLQGVHAVVNPDVSVAVFFRHEALLASRFPLHWALQGRLVGAVMAAVLFPFGQSDLVIGEGRKGADTYLKSHCRAKRRVFLQPSKLQVIDSATVLRPARPGPRFFCLLSAPLGDGRERGLDLG
jgi:hypothetical protein